jgi:hypothetical protein
MRLRSRSQLTYANVVSALAVFLLIGGGLAYADTAVAQGGAGGAEAPGPVSEKYVERFIEGQAKIVVANQPPVFPNASITGKKYRAYCIQDYDKRRNWECIYSVAIYEDSLSTPQGTVRFCGTPEGEPYEHALKVRRKRGDWLPPQLKIVGAWKMSCPLSQLEIDIWNINGPDYDPAVSEPTAYEPVPAAPEVAEQPLPKDLPPSPPGAPGGPPPGPISATSPKAPSAQKRDPNVDTFLGCSPWGQWHLSYGYNTWSYSCFWRLHTLPGGFLMGYGNDVKRYEMYYYAGRDAYGRDIARLWATGTL